MVCFLCENEVVEGERHLCVKDNTALFGQRRVEAAKVEASEFPEYLDASDFFEAEQVIDI